MLPKFSIKLRGFSFWFTDANREEILAEIERQILLRKQFCVVTPNTEFLMLARKDKEFAEILNKAEISIPDGAGIILAKKMQKKVGGRKREVRRKEKRNLRPTSNFQLPALFACFYYGCQVLFGKFASERITGADLMVDLCDLAKKKNWKVFFLGAKERVGSKAATIIFKSSPAVSKSWAAFAGDGSPAGDKETVGAINKAAKVFGKDIDVLFVAYGMGKQEKWIKRNLKKLPVKMVMGVGGGFDYIAGVVPRAPKWMRNCGLEWLWRLIREPWRVKRQLALMKFIFQIV